MDAIRLYPVKKVYVTTLYPIEKVDAIKLYPVEKVYAKISFFLGYCGTFILLKKFPLSNLYKRGFKWYHNPRGKCATGDS